MRFTKIKVKDGKIHLEYQVDRQSGTPDEVSFTCSDEPKPEFHAALAELNQDVVEICELPLEYLDRTIVTGVSFSYAGENNTMGATIIAQMKLKNSNVNLNLITPYKIEEFYSEDGGDPKQLLPEECTDRLYDLIREAEDYINGVRAQGDLFGGKKETMAEGLGKIAKDFHDDIQKGLGPGESVTISSGGRKATIDGGSNPGGMKKVVSKLRADLKKVK